MAEEEDGDAEGGSHIIWRVHSKWIFSKLLCFPLTSSWMGWKMELFSLHHNQELLLVIGRLHNLTSLTDRIWEFCLQA